MVGDTSRMQRHSDGKAILRAFVLRFGLLVLASYGMLYFADRWYAPTDGSDADFTQEYYPMYQKPLNFAAADAPFIYRQVSAVLTNLVHASEIYYSPSKTNAMSRVNPGIDQRIFFAALLTNFLGLVLAATLVGRVVERETGGFVFPLLGGLLCVMSLLSQSVVLTGMTEGVTWLFFAGLYALYMRSDRAVFAAVLLLSIFQREMISVAFGLIAAFSLLLGNKKRRYNLYVLAVSIFAFTTYTIIRKYALPAPGYEGQLTLNYLTTNLAAVHNLVMRDLVLQGFFSQNVIFISAATSFAFWLRTRAVPKDLFALMLSFAVIVAIGLAEGINNNVGRIGGLLTPAFAALAAIALYKLEKTHREPAHSGTQEPGL